MKKFILCLSLLFLTGLLVAQDNVYIKSRLNIYYIAGIRGKLSDSGSSPMANKMRITDNRDHEFWTSNNEGLQNSRKFVKMLIDPPQNGDTKITTRFFQSIVRSVLSITGQSIDIYIFNDRVQMVLDGNTPLNPSATGEISEWKNYNLCRDQNGGQGAYPCGSCLQNRRGTVGGIVGMGVSYIDPSNFFFNELFIYELTMTQLNFGPEQDVPKEVLLDMYKMRNHRGLLPSKNYATKRAIANAFAQRFHYILYKPQPNVQTFYTLSDNKNWYNLAKQNPSQGFKLVEPLACTGANGLSGSFCLRKRIQALGVQPLVMQGKKLEYTIPFAGLTPEIMLHNEWVQTNIFLDYMRLLGSTATFVQVLREAQKSPEIHSSSFGAIFREMIVGAKNKASHNPNAQYLPCVLLDFHTRCGLNKEQLYKSTGVSLVKVFNYDDEARVFHEMLQLRLLRDNRTLYRLEEITDMMGSFTSSKKLARNSNSNKK